MAQSNSLGMWWRSRKRDDVLLERRGVFETLLQPVSPCLQCRGALRRGDARFVGEVVERAAEGIENHRVVAPLARQDAQGEGEIGLRAAGDLRGVRHGGVLTDESPVAGGHGPQ